MRECMRENIRQRESVSASLQMQHSLTVPLSCQVTTWTRVLPASHLNVQIKWDGQKTKCFHLAGERLSSHFRDVKTAVNFACVKWFTFLLLEAAPQWKEFDVIIYCAVRSWKTTCGRSWRDFSFGWELNRSEIEVNEAKSSYFWAEMVFLQMWSTIWKLLEFLYICSKL